MSQVVILRYGKQNTIMIALGMNAANLVEGVRYCCPAPISLLHHVEAENRALMLQRILKVKYEKKRLHHDWFALEDEDIAYLKTITEQTYRKLIPQMEDKHLAENPPLQRQSNGNRQHRRHVKSIDKLEAMRQQLLEKAQNSTVFICRRKQA